MFSYPGEKIYSLRYIFVNDLMLKIIGRLVPLCLVPLNFVVSNVYNYSNFKSSYAKSLGSTAIRQKIIKKTKIILVRLPSSSVKFLPITTFGCFGSLKSYNIGKVVEGRWGNSSKLYKKITVRGVAKNPVDHPNGGRTKAKQPERSP
jgi:large subunit ribosomal protein L2